MTELTVLVPSRGRPQALREMASAFHLTCQADTTLAFVVDVDDPRLSDYRAEAEEVWHDDIQDFEMLYHYPEYHGRGMVAALNKAAHNICVAWVGTGECTDGRCPAPPHEAPYAVGFMGDDHRPRSRGWDRRYLDSLRSGNLFVYGNDLLQGREMPTQVAMQSSVVEKLGYMAPPEFFHLCVDLVWRDWGAGVSRIEYLDDVIIEHMHPANGKAALDEGYERVNSSAVVAKDSAWYYTWKETRLHGELEKLRELP